jgi:D-alanyl-D-alanine carboxypeptidase
VFGERLSNFIELNADRYDEFQLRFPELPFDVIVALVNTDVDLEAYGTYRMVTDPYDYLVLMNQNYKLPSDFIPDDLVSIPGRGSLRYTAAHAYMAMRDEARAEGLTFISMSAYRSYATQRRLFNNSVNRRGLEATLTMIARPGHSEHQTGLAVDILHRSNVSTLRSANFQDTREFEWLQENAHRFGFILRYPDGMMELHGYIFEPWHWRFVGEEVATIMFEQGIATFEEYHGRFIVTSACLADHAVRDVIYHGSLLDS